MSRFNDLLLYNFNKNINNPILSSNYYTICLLKSQKNYSNSQSNYLKNWKIKVHKKFKKFRKNFINRLNFRKISSTIELTRTNNKHNKNRGKGKIKNKNSKNDYNYNLRIYCFLSDLKNYDESINDGNNNHHGYKLEDIPIPYRDLAEVFSKKNADKLPLHKFTDFEIVLQKGCNFTLWSNLFSILRRIPDIKRIYRRNFGHYEYLVMPFG